MSKTACHFTITGEFFTRERMIDVGWEAGLRALTECIFDFGYDNAVAVLKGDKRLEGENKLKLVAEKQESREKITSLLNWKYAGIVHVSGKYYRPYAYVDNWGWQDIPKGLANTERGRPFEANSLGRSQHYMDDSRKDLAVWLEYKDKGVVTSKVAVLWNEVSAPPPWMQIHTNMCWQDALNEYLRTGKHRLEHRGHQQWYPGQKCPHPEPKTKQVKQVKQVKQEDEDIPVMPPPDTKLESDSGYITSDGTFYPCAYNGHRALADALVYHLVNKNETNSQHRADLLGWVKLGVSLLSKKADAFHVCEMALTEQQVHTLLEWHHKHQVKLPFWWEDKQPLSPK